MNNYEYVPADLEVCDYANQQGMDIVENPNLYFIAREGCRVTYGKSDEEKYELNKKYVLFFIREFKKANKQQIKEKKQILLKKPLLDQKERQFLMQKDNSLTTLKLTQKQINYSPYLANIASNGIFEIAGSVQ